MEQLVGREAELQAVSHALANSAPACIVLEGDAGVGKTALWDVGVAEATARGMRVVVARPAEAETGLSYAALGDLLGPIADDAGTDLPPLQRHAMDVALLRAAADAGPVDTRAVGAATLSLLEVAAAGAPLLLAVDDIQWLDSASAAALGFALRRLGETPVLMLATLRVGSSPERLDVGLSEERVLRISVGALGARPLRRLLQAHLGEALSRPALAQVAELSGGNPYYALELGRAALRRAGDEAPGADLPLPDGIEAVLQERLGTLPPATREALGAVAAMGHPTVAAAATAVDLDALDAAFAAGVLREQARTIRFEHPLLAESAYRMLGPGRRRAVHERLAKYATDAEERGRHLAAAWTDPHSGVAAEIDQGAHAAGARGARASAAELFEASARLEPDLDLSAQRRIAAVREHMAAGDGRRARALAHSIFDSLSPGPLRARALVVLSEGEGHFEELTGYAQMAVAEAGDDRETLIEALLMEGVLRLLQQRQDEAHAAFGPREGAVWRGHAPGASGKGPVRQRRPRTHSRRAWRDGAAVGGGRAGGRRAHPKRPLGTGHSARARPHVLGRAREGETHP